MKLGTMNNPRVDPIGEVKWIVENGFDFLDLTIELPKAYDFEWERIKEIIGDMEVIGHTDPVLPYAYPVPELTEAALRVFRRYLDIFQGFGARYMNIHPCYFTPIGLSKQVVELNIAVLKEIVALARDYSVQVMLENFVSPFGNPDEFARICDAVPGLMVHLDVGHANLKQEKNVTEAFFRRFGDRIVHVHLSDNRGKYDDHLPLGVGLIDWREMVSVFKRYGYDGTMTLEVFSIDKDYILMSREKFLRWWNEVEG